VCFMAGSQPFSDCSASFDLHVALSSNIILSHSLAYRNPYNCTIVSKTSLPAVTSSSVLDLFRPVHQIPFELTFVSAYIFPSRTPHLLVTYFQDAVWSLCSHVLGTTVYSACPQVFTREVVPLCNYWPHSELGACEEPGEGASLAFY
jgi:hypothetical protein